MTLLEREQELEALSASIDEIAAGEPGRVALVSGEAGIGKTTLIRALCEQHPGPRVLWGYCDALATPRALGPFVDIAESDGAALAAVLAGSDATPDAVARATYDDAGDEPAVVVLEDLHWADDATLDVVRLLVRRIEDTRTLLLLTYRNDQLHRMHPLQIALGDLPVGVVRRLLLAPLSKAAVEQLASATGIDVPALYHRTAGNPFFVTEVLAAGEGTVPATVRDAVLGRGARLSEAGRTVLDAVAIEPEGTELWMLEALVDDPGPGLEACVAAGLLQPHRKAVRFRHEIARVAIEGAIAPHQRVLLHRRALGVLTAAIGRRPDLARLAHHAEAADDAEAVLRFAPEAATRAAAVGSHREAAAQLARALRYADQLPPQERVELLERRSFECYLIGDMASGIEARRATIAEHRATKNRLGEGDAHRWLSRLLWFSGDNAIAEDEAQLAIDLLQPLDPGRELAMAYSNMSQLGMLSSDAERAISWGQRAMVLAEALDERGILAHALNNIGTIELLNGDPAGPAKLERSLQIALDDNLEEHVARAYTNMGSTLADLHDHPGARRWLNEGIAYCLERDLDSWTIYMTGYRARMQLRTGHWDEAAADATFIRDRDHLAASQVLPLVILGQIRARRGDPDPWALLDVAHEIAKGTGELQRLAPTAIARAEALWLQGDVAAIDAETAEALALSVQRASPWNTGALAVWRRRAGILEQVDAPAVAEPWQLELAGQPTAAAEAWARLDCPFDAALALAHSSGESDRREALAALQSLGARPAATRVARTLRAAGARNVLRGPRAATQENPAGLTHRELEVLTLVAEGLTNAAIAERLFISPRTAGHHIAAILQKLGSRTRSQAAAEAVRLGIVAR